MPDKKISELTAYTTPIATDELPIVDVTSGITKKVAKSDLIAQPISDLTDVTISAPAVDDTLRFNGTDWVNGVPATSSASAGIEFFPDTTDIIGKTTENDFVVETLNKYPVTTTPEGAEAISCVSNTVIGSAYLYNTALGRTVIDSGNWAFDFYLSVSSTSAGRVSTVTNNIYKVSPYSSPTITITGSGTSRTCTASSGTPFATANIDASATNTLASFVQTPKGVYQITARTSDTEVTISTPSGYGNESAVAFSVWKKLFGVTSPTITNLTTNYGLYSLNIAQPSFTVAATDKLGLVVFGTSNNTTTVNYVYNGTTHYSHFSTPLITLHNNLAGLQGGTSNEQYHLTSAQHSVINTPVTSGYLMTSDGSKWTAQPAPVSVSVTTKGDLQTYSTTPARLPVGTNGQVLEARSTETTGLKWVDPVGTASFVYNEVPSGTVNGSNTDFTLAATPVSGTLEVFLDGVLQKSGAGNDYTLSTATITFLTAPLTGSNILCAYQSVASTSGNADTLDGQHAPSGTIVGTSDTQTLTNKTLTSPKLNENVTLTSTSTELNVLDGTTGAWSGATPTPTSQGGSFTTVSATTRYVKIGRIVFISVAVSITNKGTATGGIIVTLPYTSVTGYTSVLNGRENSVGGKQLQGLISSNASSVTIFNYDNSSPIADGANLYLSGTYEAAA